MLLIYLDGPIYLYVFIDQKGIIIMIVEKMLIIHRSKKLMQKHNIRNNHCLLQLMNLNPYKCDLIKVRFCFFVLL